MQWIHHPTYAFLQQTLIVILPQLCESPLEALWSTLTMCITSFGQLCTNCRMCITYIFIIAYEWNRQEKWTHTHSTSRLSLSLESTWWKKRWHLWKELLVCEIYWSFQISFYRISQNCKCLSTTIIRLRLILNTPNWCILVYDYRWELST